MVGRRGFEPWTLGLKVRCSDQAELPARVAGERCGSALRVLPQTVRAPSPSYLSMNPGRSSPLFRERGPVNRTYRTVPTCG